jgi:hypothetical protein
MMRLLVRGAALLLLVGLGGVTFALGELRFALAGVAICCLVEIGLALRARRSRPDAAVDRSRLSATQVACTEHDGALTVRLTGEEQAGGRAAYVLLSRTLRLSQQPVRPNDDGPYLELCDRRWSVHGAIEDAYLTPGFLRLTLDARGAEALGAGQVCVALPTGNDQRSLERALGKILRGVPFTSDRSMPEEAPELPASLAP